MSRYIVDIHGDIEGDFDIIGKYVEPTADVVEVVRCKDCKFYAPQNRPSYGRGNHKAKCCTRTALMKVSESDFCSFGERREDGKIH